MNTTAPHSWESDEYSDLQPLEVYEKRTGTPIAAMTQEAFREVDTLPMPEPDAEGLVTIRVHPSTLRALRRLALLLGTDIPEAAEFAAVGWAGEL